MLSLSLGMTFQVVDKFGWVICYDTVDTCINSNLEFFVSVENPEINLFQKV